MLSIREGSFKMSIDKGILEDFAIEANELLDEAEDGLLKLNQQQDLKKIYDLVFRGFHSLKGSSGMIGFNDLQRHLHLLEDYLQKSKGDLEHFKNSADYYLLGIDAARKILSGETIKFTYEVYGSKKDEKTNLKNKKIIYISQTKIKPLGEVLLSLVTTFNFLLKIIDFTDLEEGQLLKEDYDILVSDFSLDIVKKIIPKKNEKKPLILIVDEISFDVHEPSVFQLLKKTDDKIRIVFTIRNAFADADNTLMLEKAKSLMMYMYSDLEEYLIEKNKLEIQKSLSIEIREFIKNSKGKNA